jgi:hypothetical protein
MLQINGLGRIDALDLTCQRPLGAGCKWHGFSFSQSSTTSRLAIGPTETGAFPRGKVVGALSRPFTTI